VVGGSFQSPASDDKTSARRYAFAHRFLLTGDSKPRTNVIPRQVALDQIFDEILRSQRSAELWWRAILSEYLFVLVADDFFDFQNSNLKFQNPDLKIIYDLNFEGHVEQSLSFLSASAIFSRSFSFLGDTSSA